MVLALLQAHQTHVLVSERQGQLMANTVDVQLEHWTGMQAGLKGLLLGVFYIYINFGILPLCTDLWNGTSCISISWFLCLDS